MEVVEVIEKKRASSFGKLLLSSVVHFLTSFPYQAFPSLCKSGLEDEEEDESELHGQTLKDKWSRLHNAAKRLDGRKIEQIVRPLSSHRLNGHSHNCRSKASRASKRTGDFRSGVSWTPYHRLLRDINRPRYLYFTARMGFRHHRRQQPGQLLTPSRHLLSTIVHAQLVRSLKHKNFRLLR